MKRRPISTFAMVFSRFCRGLLAILWLLSVGLAWGQLPVMVGPDHNGELVCTNLEPGTVASIEWAPTPTGPWTNSWAGLQAITVDSNGMIRASVPMYYRVLGVARVLPPSMALVPAGSFVMGDSFSEAFYRERPAHAVYVNGFYIDRCEVTKQLWDEVRQWAITNGFAFVRAGGGKGPSHPVHSVNWFDAVKWCNARSLKERLTPAYYTDAARTTVYVSGEIAPFVKWDARGYRLPTEAEWEKAARGGSTDGRRFPWGNTITHAWANYNSIGAYAYDASPTSGYHPDYFDGSRPYTSPVASFSANDYGLYDMAGNVLEWTWDWYAIGYYASSPPSNPRGPDTGEFRIVRGGSWLTDALYARCTFRYENIPVASVQDHVGFRCVRGRQKL